MALPYRILFICLLLTGITYSLGPWWAMQSIKRAAQADNQAQWRYWVKQEEFNDLTGKILDGLAKLKTDARILKDPEAALADYQKTKAAMPEAVQQLTGPQGFNRLLCGDLLGEPGAKPAGDTGCWALNGKLSWLSPMRVKVTFINPETQWQSSLILARVGLFSWQAVDMELPVAEIVERYAKSLGLKKPGKTDNAVPSSGA